MPAGIRVTNPGTGSVQIDENYFNMEFITRIDRLTDNSNEPAANTFGWVVYNAGYSWISLPYVPGSIVFFDEGPYCLLRGGGFRGGSFTDQPTYVFNAPAGTRVTGYRFGMPDQSATGGQGLIVRNGAGQICFDSNRRYLNIVDVITGPNYQSPYPSRVYPAGRKYAVAPCSWSGHTYFDERDALIGGQMYRYKVEEQGLMSRISGNVLQSLEANYLNTFTTGGRANYGNVHYTADLTNRSYVLLVADVTNYI